VTGKAEGPAKALSRKAFGARHQLRCGAVLNRACPSVAAAWAQVRHYTKAELRGFIRVSVGKPAQTDALLSALAEL